MRTTQAVFLAVLLAVTIGVAAQNSTNHRAPRAIDGKTNPAAIPDHVAYRMVLLSFTVGSTNPTATDLRRQQAHLKMLGLSDSEAESFKQILKDFRSQHEQWQAKQKNGTAKGSREFKKQLVQNTRAAITKALTPEHLAVFDRFVQSRKANIVTTEVE